ncbi:MAG: HAMP domain-containing protein, partial [Dehalococcoidia bacterium]
YFDPERAALFAILSELELVPDLNNAVHRIQVRLESAAAAGTISANDRAAVEADIAVAQNAMSELSRNLQASVDDNPAYRAVIVRPLDEARAGVDAFVASARSSVNASRPVRLDASELHQSTENMSDAVHGALANDLAQRISSDRTALAVVSGVSLAGLAIAIGAAFYIARSITKPINELVLAADRISLGDLEAQIGTQGSPEVDKLATSLRRMQSSLRTAIERLRARRAAA